MTFETKYLSFWTRIRKEFLGGFLIVSLIIILNSINENGDIRILSIMILGAAIIYMIQSAINSWTFINQVKISDGKCIVTGATIDTRWDKEFVIRESDIKIKSKGRGRGNVEYSLKLSSRNKSIDINQSFNWDYPSLLAIFYEFKRIKGESVIFDESYFLDIMDKKSQ